MVDSDGLLCLSIVHNENMSCQVDYCSIVDVKVAALLNWFSAKWHKVHTVFVLVNVTYILSLIN